MLVLVRKVRKMKVGDEDYCNTCEKLGTKNCRGHTSEKDDCHSGAYKMNEFKMYIRVRNFGNGNYDYVLQIKPRTVLESNGFYTETEAKQKGKELAVRLNIGMKKKVTVIK